MGLKIVTINIPEQVLDAIQSLIQSGFYNSRSQIVREALKNKLETFHDLEEKVALIKGISTGTAEMHQVGELFHRKLELNFTIFYFN
jgi:Arc/MetJ-type ribon-helix-helix transcriptional regulator